MRAVAAALTLASCATASTSAPDFSWIEGCWRDSVTRAVWEHVDGEWRADVDIETVCSAGGRRSSCIYSISQEQGVWTFSDEITDNVQTYSLVEFENGRAKFRALGHSLRAQPRIFLTIAVENDQYSMIETGGVVPVVWMDAERC